MVNLTERVGDKLDGFPSSIMAKPGMRGLCSFFLQSLHEDDAPYDITYYGKPNLAECQAI